MNVFVLATLDTKGAEAALIRDYLKSQNVDVTVVDTSAIGETVFAGDVTRERVYEAAGSSLSEIVNKNDRGYAVTMAAKGATKIVEQAFANQQLAGVIAIGGSAGTTIGTTAMKALPIGVPKVMVSTLASGQVRQYVGDKDIMMMNSIVDISGINRISRSVLTGAAAAMVGMSADYKHRFENPQNAEDRPLIAATMFGVTTPCVQQCQKILESSGFEVLVFPASGNGGQARESLIRDGVISGVLDITTTELADELVGGILTAGPNRLTAASECGIPQVISVGATDMVNFGPPETVPSEFATRQFYHHNPTVTLMRTTVEENAKLGEEIGKKAALATGPTKILFPLKGVSALDAAGKDFEDEQARNVLMENISRHRGEVELMKLDQHINDAEFSKLAAESLLEMIQTNAT